MLLSPVAGVPEEQGVKFESIFWIYFSNIENFRHLQTVLSSRNAVQFDSA